MAAIRIVLAADHAGFDLKNELCEGLRDLKYDVTDIGATSTDPTDFPDFAHTAALGVQSGKFERGILVDILASAAAAWAERKRPFFAVFPAGSPDLPELYKARR